MNNNSTKNGILGFSYGNFFFIGKDGRVGAIDRICLNFQHHCNMRCEWCYIPFELRDTYDREETSDVVTRCREIGASVVTFGGGDPFSYEGFPDLVVHAKDQGLITHVDTNAISLTAKKLERCLGSMDLMALPLDGPAPTHDDIRGMAGHYATIRNRLDLLNDMRGETALPTLKINTIVTKRNIASISGLCNIVRSVNAQRWSIYQYWPLINDKEHIKKYSIDNDEYITMLDDLIEMMPGFVVEGNLYENRASTYLFVSHSGILYTHDIHDYNSYMIIGSIFDDENINKWKQLGRTTIRAAANDRYFTKSKEYIK